MGVGRKTAFFALFLLNLYTVAAVAGSSAVFCSETRKKAARNHDPEDIFTSVTGSLDVSGDQEQALPPHHIPGHGLRPDQARSLLNYIRGNYGDVDLGPPDGEHRYVKGGEASVYIPKQGTDVVRITKMAKKDGPEKFKKYVAAVNKARAAGLDGALVLPSHRGKVAVGNETFIIETYAKYDGTLTDLYATDFYKKMSFQDRLKLANRLAQILKDLHAAKLFHYDLKSDNVLFRKGPHGEIELAISDLGLLSDPEHTEKGSSPGTAYYVAPEVVGGVLTNPRADVYPMGVVFGELLTGERALDTAKSESSKLKDQQGSTVHEVKNSNTPPKTPPQFHTAEGFAGAQVQTRLSFPTSTEGVSRLTPEEKVARQNLAVLSWFPFRNAKDMAEATQLAADSPEKFSLWFVRTAFPAMSAAGSSYHWKENGSLIAQAIVSNDVFAGWVYNHMEEIPWHARRKLFADLKDIQKAAQAAEDAKASSTFGKYKAEFRAGALIPHTRVYVNDQANVYTLFFGRYANQFPLGEMIKKFDRLEEANRRLTQIPQSEK